MQSSSLLMTMLSKFEMICKNSCEKMTKREMTFIYFQDEGLKLSYSSGEVVSTLTGLHCPNA